MTAHRLFVGREPSPGVTQNDFVWPEVGREGSLRTSIGPEGRELATASLPVIDLLRLGVAVYLVDRTTRRPRDWSRDLELSLPVSDPVAWSVRANAVAGLLDFLTGDRWDLTFRQGPTIPITRAVAERRSEHDLVSLFSGGMDSFAGAALALRTAERPLLVGHWNWAPTSGMQAAAHEALRELTGATPEFRAVHVGRRSVQIDGTPFGEERTSRSRSLLFIAIGVAVATGTRARELWIPENGWVSLNVPLDGSRRCTLSTRTTHPGLIHELNGLLRDLGIDLAICNPWGGRTKGDLVRWVAERWDPAAASAAFAATNSCARSDMRFLGQTPECPLWRLLRVPCPARRVHRRGRGRRDPLRRGDAPG